MDHFEQEVAIRERAYAIWEEEGRPHGREWEHWERASHYVTTRRATANVAKAAKPPRKTTVKGRIRTAFKSAISA